MTRLTLDHRTMPTADVGAPNPFPPIQGDASLDKSADLTAATETIRTRAGYGRVATISPYLMQDGYSRERSPQRHPVAVLENEHLHATFLLNQGGRMWSLRQLSTGRELLYTNPIFQPANLALRNAWFAGGVEWNTGTIGHTPLTCAPLHAARVLGDDGAPVLRLYEFERLRRVVYQLDIHLPPGSETLFVHVRITNPNEHETPMYWWSNIAVPQDVSTRVLAPARHAWNYSYDNILRHDPVVPGSETADYDAAADISYPARFSDAADFFFDLDGVRQPWIAAVDGFGRGLFQTSTRELSGRKLFRWGTSRGGRRWQEWLSGPLTDPAGGYAEIQAGLAATQFEHLPMPAGAVWSWTESYGPIELDADTAHGAWHSARAAAEDYVISAVPPARLTEIDAAAAALATREPDTWLHTGSGWGALEQRLRALSGEPPLDLPGTPFPDGTLGDEQQPWVELLDTGRYPDPADGEFPSSVHLHPVLTEALTHSPGWAAPALAGVAKASAGDWAGAATDWEESLTRHDNAYAHRNLALAARRGGDTQAMSDEYLRALALSPSPTLAIEALGALVDIGTKHGATLALAALDRLPLEWRLGGRLRMLEARAALAAGLAEHCAAILTDPTLEVADLREGEASLDELWFACQAARLAAERGIDGGDEHALSALRDEVERTIALPPHLDFRMKPGPSAG
jgi:hypothetical protein